MKRKCFILIMFVVMLIGVKNVSALEKCSDDNTVLKCKYSNVIVTLNKDSDSVKVEGMSGSGISTLQMSDFVKNNKFYCPDNIYTACLDVTGNSNLGCNKTGYYLNDKPNLYDMFGKKVSSVVKDSDSRSISLNEDNSCSNSNTSVTTKSYCSYYKFDSSNSDNSEFKFNVIIDSENNTISSDTDELDEEMLSIWKNSISSNKDNTCYVIYNCNGKYYFSIEDAPSGDQGKCYKLCDINDRDCKNDVCIKYDEYIKEIKNKYDEYNKSCDKKSKCDEYNKSCDKKTGCNASELTKANTYINFTRVLCNSILSTRNANDFCVKKCLNMSKDISELKETYGIEKTKGDKCPLGSGLIAFVYNILKWMKYIAPVLVILLGIIDFIKALAASDDDAMKKAQKKFIIRLVAAALLFLLPLIIDYVLGVFHLVNENCDINSIFK